jgi:hypothetical protein
MAQLRCDTCTHLNQGFCSKLEEAVPNVLAKFFYGGAIGLYGGTVAYPSKCGIEKKQSREAEFELRVLVPERIARGTADNSIEPTQGC